MLKAQKVIRAEYSDGVFKPLEKVNLPEGEKVEIEIKAQKSKKIRISSGYMERYRNK